MQVTLRTIDSGPLKGYHVLDVDKARFHQYINRAIAMDISYLWNGKEHHLGSFPPTYYGIDCSGFVDAVLAYSTSMQSERAGLPDGSWLEAAWFGSHNFKSHKVVSAADYRSFASVNDGRIRIGVHYPNGRGGGEVGHIWFLHQDPHNPSSVVTSESYGGNGPGRRPWDHKWFLDHCDIIYVLTD